MTAPALPREIAEAGVGVGRLIRYDPRWPDGFNPTTAGFLRSFIGPLLGLPFDLIVMSAMAASGSAPISNRLMGVAVLSHLINGLGFPLLVAAIARPLKIGAGYAGFVVIVNWASLFVSVCTAAASPLALVGTAGGAAFTFVWLAMFGVSLFITWRAARETLSDEIPIALLMVVLSVAVGVVADQVSGFVLGVSSVG